MRILVTNWRDIEHPNSGGAEVFTHEVSKRLVERGHEITLFTAAFDGCDDEAVVDGVRVVRSGGRFGVYRAAKTFYRRHCRGEIDVVVDEINTRPFMTPAYVAEPVVALIHQLAREFWLYETPFPIDRLGYHWLEDRWLKRYTDVPTITVSDSTRQDLLGLGFEDVTVVPQGLCEEPVEELPEKADVPTVLFVGRMTEAKRPAHALEAFARITNWLPDAELHMIGDGYLLDDLQARATENVTFHGYVPEERKRELMKRSHVLVVPSVREGWGLVVTEANALGTPVVGYDVPGLRDSVEDGKTGYLCGSEPKAMAEAVRTILADETGRFSENAIRYAERFGWDRTTAKFETQLLEVTQHA